ncbi:MAG: 2-oxo acid dehydrogenase subunit E2 [Elusimicrobia bacterium]|nr:2-oxo acid dehydrogenase subunit E2 [Elusimicrobiota bacterium]
MATYEFKLPDIGEGLTEGEIVKWHVREGDSVTENQPLVNVLTDKAEVEIPSPKTGKIAKLMAKEGQKVAVHATFVVFELGGAGPSTPAAAPAKKEVAAHATTTTAPPQEAPAHHGDTLAMPGVRKLAQQLKVDLASVRGTGPGGRVLEADVQKAAGTKPHKPSPSPSPAPTARETGEGDEQVPFVGIRRRTAEKMSFSKRTVAHVTHMDEADVTALVALREELKPEAAERGVKLTYLPFVIRALAKTLPEYPNLNSSLDEEKGVLTRRRAYHIGIATAAPQGLVVPVVKDAGPKDLWTLAGDVSRLAEKARSGRIEVSELQGGTITITNIGPIGGLFATPIVNHPEVAILAVMKIQKRPVVRDGGIHVRDMVNLALSFDHRVVDGAEAAYFMNTLIKHLENPRTLL